MIKLAKLLTEAIEYFKPKISKDPIHPNFLTVNIKYPVGIGGALSVGGLKTASGQEREEGAVKALAMGNKIAKELQSKYNIEDIEVSDLKNGTVQVFAVSDDFINKKINEKQMTPAQKKKRGKIFDKLVAGGMPEDKAGPIATSKAMSEKLDPVGQEDADPDNDGKKNTPSDRYILNRRKAIAKNINEGGDHEVAMAMSSLKSIIKSSVTLLNKLGNEERNIPGWIQDHITNAENYIDQAAQGFHELHHDE
jgi:hypothetical protein